MAFVTTTSNFSTHTVINTIAKLIEPNTYGTLGSPAGMRVHIPDATSQAKQDQIQSALDNYGALTVTADKTTMTEGDADPVVSCNDAAISGDATVGYAVLLDGQLYADGTDTVTAGSVSLTLSSPVNGVYDVYIYRKSGTYASGKVSITVNEA